MRLLFVSCLLPHPSVAHGGGTDLFHLIESLGRRHEVHLVSIASEDELPHVEKIRPYCASLRTVTPAWTLPQKWRSLRRGLLADPLHLGRRAQREMREHIRQVVDGGVDVVQFEWTETARYRDAVPAGRAATVLDEVDVSFRPRVYRARQMAPGLPRVWARVRAARARRAELAVCARFDLVLARSECDRQALLRLRPGLNVEILHPWTHAEEFAGIGAEARDPGRLLFVGAMDRDENCQAVEYFCREIFPHVRAACPEARLEIAGATPPSRVRRLGVGPGVEVTGYVADLREAYARCDVVVAPIQLPGGVFNKVVDGMAAGRPVVTTSLGNEGIAAPVGDAVLIGDAPLAFAERVIDLVRNRTLWQRIAQEGRRHVQAKYRWEDDVAGLEAMYRRLGADGGAKACRMSS